MNRLLLRIKSAIIRLLFGLKTKMILSFSIVITLSVGFTLYFSVAKYSNMLQKNNIRYSNQVLGNLISNINDYINGIESITDIVIYNLYIQNYLIEKKHNEVVKNNSYLGNSNYISQNFEKSIELLGNLIYTHKDIASILIFSKNELALYKSSNLNINTKYDFENDFWYISTLKTNKKIIITDPHKQSYITKNNENVLSISRQIEGYDGLGEIGIVLIDVNMKVIEDVCRFSQLIGNGYIFIVNDSGDIIFNEKNNYITEGFNLQNKLYQDVLPIILNQKVGSCIAKIDNEKQQFVYKHIDKTGWTIVAVTPYSDMVSEARSIRNIIFLAGIICFLVTIILVGFLTKRFTNPILKLASMMNQADNGNLNIRANISTNDEVSTLSHSFNKMLERINALMKQVVSEQEEKRKSYLKVLQAQINPHFLYNTLDSIIWMIASNNNNAIKMIEALSRFFRISLNRGQELITIEEELEHVRNYLIIQGMRYQNKIDYIITADENILKYKTLNILLQPIVENSIYHGIKNSDKKGTISIHAYKENEIIILKVEDDGIGMNEETCSNILKNEYKDKKSFSSGIGVQNVNSRIKLYFGNMYGLRFESALGMGTTVFISLPLLK